MPEPVGIISFQGVDEPLYLFRLVFASNTSQFVLLNDVLLEQDTDRLELLLVLRPLQSPGLLLDTVNLPLDFLYFVEPDDDSRCAKLPRTLRETALAIAKVLIGSVFEDSPALMWSVLGAVLVVLVHRCDTLPSAGITESG
ncbi:Uncharacterised protein [Mycobacteroides abscessus subsp. abscessus]|nr:Uncharacterised protein [Mycobacteroides abscessus subsp. abscessus]